MNLPESDTGDALETPVLLLVFSRPDTTKRVFEVIRKQRPKKLFIAADGPRVDKPGERERCEEVRRIVAEVDWPCEVHKLFREENLGCGKAVSGAISWFFDHVSEGIILEDDTCPSSDFFIFCSQLLEKYRDDLRVMSIGGTSLSSQIRTDYPYSYYFSNWDHIWGWATWRRAWKHYDYNMKHYPEVVKRGYFKEGYSSIHEFFFKKYVYERAYFNSNEVTWWDYQWAFARKINSGLVIVPTKNLVINLGLGEGSTNTSSDRWGFLRMEEMNFPLIHPPFVIHDRVIDNKVFRKYLTTPFSRFKSYVKVFLLRLGLMK